MATWAKFEREAPELAAAADQLWPGVTALHRGAEPPRGGPTFAVAYLATVRPDGAPRLHPFCPFLVDGRLLAAIPARSPKGDDLRRDPRCAIHATPGPDDLELCIRARGAEVDDDSERGAALRRAVGEVVGRSGVGGMIESTTHDPLFDFALEQVDVARWVDVGRPGTHAERRRWRSD